MLVRDNLRARVSPLGGTVMNFTAGGQDIIYPWHMVGNKARGGIPICAPWFGASIFGEKKHGHLRDLMAHDVLYHSADRVVLKFVHNGTRIYPWKLKYFVTVELERWGLRIELRIERQTDSVAGLAPILPAFHPYFFCTNTRTLEVRMGSTVLRGFSATATLHNLESHKVQIVGTPRPVLMELGDRFTCPNSRLALWTDDPSQYVCVEPILADPQLLHTTHSPKLAVGSSTADLVMALSVR